MSDRMLLVYCGLLFTLTAFCLDITLPGLIQTSHDLATSYTLAQYTITVYFLTSAIAQLFAGSLSDRFGRKPVLAAGLFVVLVGGLMCAVAPTIETLLAGRMLQGLGAAAGPVVARAILRDCFSGEKLARNMAISMTVFAIGPIIAPLLGAGLMEIGSWRLGYWAMAIGACGLLFGLPFLQETVPGKQLDALRPSKFAEAAVAVFRNRQSRHFLIVTAISLLCITTVITGLTEIYKTEFGVGPTMFAFFFAFQGLGIILGQSVNHYAIARIGVQATMRLAASIISASAIAMLIGAYFDLLNAYGLAAILFCFMSGFLVVMSNSASLMLGPHPKIAGAVSSIYGFLPQFFSTIVISVAVIFTVGNFVLWALSMVIACLATLFSLLIWKPDRA